MNTQVGLRDAYEHHSQASSHLILKAGIRGVQALARKGSQTWLHVL